MVLARLPSWAKVSLFLPDGCPAPYRPLRPELGVMVAPSGNVFFPLSCCSGAHGSCPQPQLGPIQLKEPGGTEMYMPGWRQMLSASIRVSTGCLRGGARSRLCARDVRVHFPEPPH